MNRFISLKIVMALLTVLISVLLPAAGISLAAPGEKPPYTMTITGNEFFSERELLKSADTELQMFALKNYRKADIDDAAFQMRSTYLQAGFAFVTVDYSYEQKADLVQVAFNITEGPRVFLNEINFSGNKQIKTDKLQDFFTGNSGPLGIQKKVVYNESEVKEAVTAIRDYYRGEGFRDATVQDPELSFSDNRAGVDISVTVDEGPQYFIRSIILSGDLPPELLPQLAAVKEEVTGQTYFIRRKLMLRAKLEEVYDTAGYSDADFDITVLPQDKPGRINLAAKITSGEKIKITGITIAGNSRTDDSFILNHLQFAPGDIYSDAKRRESFSSLFDSGLFSKITIELAPPTEDDSRELMVTVTELPTREIYVAPGWGSYEELRLAAGFSENNLFGIGKNGRIDGLVSTKGENLTLTYIDPWLFRTDISMDIPVHYERREEPSYTSEEKGFDIFFSRELSNSLTVTTSYQYKITQLSDLSDETILQEEEENYNKGTFGIQAVHDTRNDIFYPSEGLRLAGGVDLSLPEYGSEIEFGRLTLSSRYFMELPREYILGLRARTGLIIPLGEQTFIPISERFFNGGESSVRSYEHSQIGPKDADLEPIGGLGYNLFSIELRKHLYRSFATSVFIDAGNISPNKSAVARDYASYESRSELQNDTLKDFFSDFKFGIGIGLQYLLPVGPIRIDVAYNPDPDETWDEKDWTFHFSLGMAF